MRELAPFKKKHYTEIDHLYTIGIVLVILGHSHSSDWDTFSGTILETALEFLYTFHMPLFFVTAGFLFASSSRIEQEGYRTWIGKKAIRLLTPYFVLSLAAIMPKWLISGSAESVIVLLLRPRLGIWGHFWFIPVLFLIYAIWGFVRKITQKKNKASVQLVATLISSVLYFLPIASQWFGLNDIKENCIFFAGGGIAYFLQAEHRNRLNNKTYKGVACFFAISVSAFLFWRYNGFAAAKLMIAVLMIAACWISATILRENRISKWMSAHNFTFYIYSWPFQAVMMVLCERLCCPWQIMTLCMFFAGLAGPAWIILVYDKCRWIHCDFFDLILGTRGKNEK